MDLEAMRSVARAAALVGAEAVRGGVRPEVGAAKGLPGDWVTEVDLASERAIAGFLASETPSVPFVGEELGGVAPGSSVRWVVDPLDGTTNYVHGFWAVGGCPWRWLTAIGRSPGRWRPRSSVRSGTRRPAAGRCGSAQAGPSRAG